MDRVVGPERLRLGQIARLADQGVVYVEELELAAERIQAERRRPEVR